MSGGMDAWNGIVSRAEIDQGEVLLRGDETPAQILAMAFCLEEQSRRFYQRLADQAASPALTQVAARLTRAEVGHRETVRGLCRRYCSGGEIDTPETALPKQFLEGGVTPDQILDRFPEVLQDQDHLLDLALSLETDALDFYLRMARQFEDEAHEVLLELAGEEKKHLAHLGRMRDRE